MAQRWVSPNQQRRLARIPEDKREKLSQGIASLYGRSSKTPSAFEQLQTAERAARLREAGTPLERYTYETLGLEPGLDRAMILPVAGRGADRELAMPGMVYEAAKALMTPGAVASGVPVSYEDVANLAGNVMGGGYAGSTPIDGAVAGMAVKTKGGLFIPQNIKSGLSRLVDSYAEQLTPLGLDPTETAKKARKYFTTTYGTNEDPLRTAVLESRLNPTAVRSERGELDFRDYLLSAARRQHAETSDTQQRIKSGELPTDTPLDADALADFHALYDDFLGLDTTLYKRGRPDYNARDADYARRNAALAAERVPDDFSNPQKYIDYVDPEARLAETERDLLNASGTSDWAQEQRQRSENKKLLFESLLGRGDAPNQSLVRAMQNSDFVYDIDNPRLPFLEPDYVARGARSIPPETAARMSFPELVVAASKNMERYGDIDKIISYAERGKPVPKQYWLELGVEPIASIGDKKWMRIIDPTFTRLESAHMGHSVRGYADNSFYGVGSRGPKAILDGSAQVYSLRNANTGKPSVTVEVEALPNNPPEVRQIKGPQNKRPSAEDFDAIFALFDNLKVDPIDLPVEYYGGSSNGVNWGKEYRDRLNSRQGKPFASGGPVTMPSNYSKGRWRLL